MNQIRQYPMSNVQYPMSKGNSRAAPGSTRRATGGPGFVVGRGGDPADRNGAGTTSRRKGKFQYSIFNIQFSAFKGSRRTARGLVPPTAGFTLIEILAAMAVLVVLVLALTRMFVEATGITNRGTTMLMRNSTIETAMETLLQDAEGMVVNERLACYVEADTGDTDEYGFGFDDVWFISTSGDQDDDLPYEYFHFYVTNNLRTNATGAAYMRFDLLKERMIFAVGDSQVRPDRFYAMDTNYTQWWQFASKFPEIPYSVWDRQVLADNVVRFDVYCTGWDGTGWMASSGGIHIFDSTAGPSIPGGAALRNIPPAAFDIYLQVTSPEVMVEGGMALAAKDDLDAAAVIKAREMMIRESASLFGRAVPINGAARYNAVTVYGTNNTAYYAD